MTRYQYTSSLVLSQFHDWKTTRLQAAKMISAPSVELEERHRERAGEHASGPLPPREADRGRDGHEREQRDRDAEVGEPEAPPLGGADHPHRLDRAAEQVADRQRRAVRSDSRPSRRWRASPARATGTTLLPYGVDRCAVLRERELREPDAAEQHRNPEQRDPLAPSPPPEQDEEQDRECDQRLHVDDRQQADQHAGEGERLPARPVR